MEKITGTLSALTGINGTLSAEAGISGSITIPAEIPCEEYDGAYEFTPSGSQQTIEIAHKKATVNIIINPVPSNYGLITWNGAYLTVS